MSKLLLISLAFLAIGATTVAARVRPDGEVLTSQFSYWYPQFAKVFENLILTECKMQYNHYLIGESVFETETDMYEAGADKFTVLTQPLIDCLLKNTSEFVKGTITSAQVLLGIMPTVLVLLGASVDEVAMLANVGRRPFLAFLLGFASPTSHFSRAFHYAEPAEILARHELRLPQFRPKSWRSMGAISLAEYIIALGLAIQVIHCSYEVGTRAVSFISSETVMLPLLWVMAGGFVQMFGVFVFRLRIQGFRDSLDECGHKAQVREARLRQEERLKQEEDEGATTRQERTKLDLRSAVAWARHATSWLVGILKTFWAFRHTELKPCASKNYDIRFLTFKETKMFLVSAWAQSVTTVIHIIFGTLVYSSMMFIGSKDAVYILVRFIVSTLVCRVIIMYEIAGLREACKTPTGHESQCTARLLEYQSSHSLGDEVGELKRRSITVHMRPVSTRNTAIIERGPITPEYA
jgi:hypothetical protein